MDLEALFSRFEGAFATHILRAYRAGYFASMGLTGLTSGLTGFAPACYLGTGIGGCR